MIDSKYLIYHDLIGIKVYARLKTKKNNTEFSDVGIVIDETRNMLIIEKENKVKQIVKKDYIFRFELPNNRDDGVDYFLEVQGNKIVGLPVNRLRSLKKKRWFKK
ncbi:MAG: ribonuclease P protein subunit [Promethearchaeota archaeon]